MKNDINKVNAVFLVLVIILTAIAGGFYSINHSAQTPSIIELTESLPDSKEVNDKIIEELAIEYSNIFDLELIDSPYDYSKEVIAYCTYVLDRGENLELYTECDFDYISDLNYMNNIELINKQY